MKGVRRSVLFLVVVCLVAGVSQLPAQQDPPPQQQERPAGPPGRGGQQEPQIRPYDRVITKEAKTDEGVFNVHRIGERIFYEIPAAQLGKEFLWVNQIKRTTLGVGYGGQSLGSRVVRWERHGDRVLLRSVSYDVVANHGGAIARAVRDANNDTIVMAFNIEALGKDDAPVINVTRLFSTEVPELSARARLRARGFDASRTFVERVVAFPENINVEVTQTYTSPVDTGGGPQQPGKAAQGMRPGSATVLMHYSMVKLPENPMMPRLYDERVGYFSRRMTDFGVDEHRAPQRRYITRWRLEKKNPNAEISEPVKPIVYWIDPATPEKWRPYVKKGIEKWQEAFEAAGFSKAIIAKQGPTPEEDPEWSPEDARNSVIRWLPSTIENASGPHIHDPRTGEILESDIQFYHNVMNLLRAWYFLQVGPLDARAQKLPFPDDLMGELIEYVVAHEVGHTLGFQHNMKASSTYPFEKLRDPEWLRTMSHVPTLMDYSRFNYVVQPEDKIDPKLLIPGIGPYDKWATMWGYKPIPGAKTPDDERPTLNEWAKQQDQTPWYRFSTAGSRGSDPGELTEAVGDADAVKATTLGIKNLERVSGMLLKAATFDGKAFDDLNELYGRMLGQWATELTHVTAIVGGMSSQQKHTGQSGVRFQTLPREKQAEAVRYLNSTAFHAPRWALNPEILRRLEPDGALSRVRTAQSRVLNSLLNNGRLMRMVEQEALDGATVYRPSEMLADVRRGIWAETDLPAPRVDAYRRGTQRTYLTLLDGKLNGRVAAPDDLRPLIRAELRSLQASLNAAIQKTTDRITRMHFEDARDFIARALDPRFQPAAPATPAGFGFPREVTDEDDPFQLNCWPDYIILPVRYN